MITVERADAVLIQDRGRTGFLDQGVPVSGAWDRERYEQATALIDSPGAAAFEVLAGTFVAHVDQPTTISVVGELPHGWLGQSWVLGAQGRVEVEARSGPVYVGVAGLSIDSVLGSAATDLGSSLGPVRVLSGATFPAGGERQSRTLHVVSAGGPITFVSTDHIQLPQRWRVTSQARSGTRIAPVESWSTEAPRTLASRPMMPGAIQIVSSTEAIILGPDSGVTGGYMVAGVIATVDLSRIARLREGEEVTLVATSAEEAYRKSQRHTFRVVGLPE